MNVTVVDEVVDGKLVFPIIAKFKKTGVLVLFINDHCGTVLNSNNDIFYKIGQFNDNWINLSCPDKWEIIDDITLRFKRSL